MYTVTCKKYSIDIGAEEEFTLHDPDINSPNRIYGATVEQSINAVHQLKFTVNLRHPNYKNPTT